MENDVFFKELYKCAKLSIEQILQYDQKFYALALGVTYVGDMPIISAISEESVIKDHERTKLPLPLLKYNFDDSCFAYFGYYKNLIKFHELLQERPQNLEKPTDWEREIQIRYNYLLEIGKKIRKEVLINYPHDILLIIRNIPDELEDDEINKQVNDINSPLFRDYLINS